MDKPRLAFVFPGQGAQAPGMGQDVYEEYDAAKAVFKAADERLGFSISELCFEGPEDKLKETAIAQPAIVTTSLAYLAALRDMEVLPEPEFVAGHSLGEYTALAAAGVLDVADTVQLAALRGRMMHLAAIQSPGSMAAVLGMDEATLKQVASEAGVYIANYNSPGQVVISGDKDKMAAASDALIAKGAKVVPLAVSGAFHTPLMVPAADGLAKVIERLQFKDAAIPIIANTTGEPITSADDIKAELLKQLTTSVYWQKSIEFMIQAGITTFIEIGPGKVLSGLIRRINRDVKTINISEAQSIKNLQATTWT
ncbi:ACP S-malonyltransferase [Dehalogenimonas etheniformans]|uniref:Malonyl CoA-acyl carrier protein transacylase n=1 Tax=Dehalogenimonas etheniformans TaxID=1536648 RepID=A0A2P5P8F2_9CHLR|nr:ACP S-malonyltransferase [Dehalogenimonas etheniformans]PPD58566.1 [acyl-carrier-protein] S-malonyltransferase [Dehalogenimonas etheniformans]QNT76669.1 ACP S-malonyltransferase [Dehalogenimonas etheniformans]